MMRSALVIGFAVVIVNVFGAFTPSKAVAGAGRNGICMDGHNMITMHNNQQVMYWKQSTPNNTKKRAFVSGVVESVDPDRNGHAHFYLRIGAGMGKLPIIEIVFNNSFGTLPKIYPGMKMEVCGDYITTLVQNGPYPPSPAGAIIHWVHESNSPRHADGFVMIGDDIYGMIGRGPVKRQKFTYDGAWQRPYGAPY